MAEHLLRSRLGRDSGWTVCSAGVSAVAGMPASAAGVEAMRECGSDLSSHRSRPVDSAAVDAAAVIVVMTAAHCGQMKALFPHAAQKVFLLKSFTPEGGTGDVRDPIGASVDVYRSIRDEIAEALPGLISFLECIEVR